MLIAKSGTGETHRSERSRAEHSQTKLIEIEIKLQIEVVFKLCGDEGDSLVAEATIKNQSQT